MIPLIFGWRVRPLTSQINLLFQSLYPQLRKNSPSQGKQPNMKFKALLSVVRTSFAGRLTGCYGALEITAALREG